MWITDGTEPGTQRLWTLPDADAEAHYWLIPHNNLVTFFLMYPSKELVMWRTDGTTAGTELFLDLNPGKMSSSPHQLTHYAGRMYFSANDGELGEELYRTDGTVVGTELVADIAKGPGSSFLDQLTVSRFSLFFEASTPETGTELYKTIVLP